MTISSNGKVSKTTQKLREQRIRKKIYKKCILCNTENTHIWYEICFRCWLKIEAKTGFSPTVVKQERPN